jgi:hypothetical protein
MRARLFAALLPESDDPRCRLICGAGVHYGERDAPEPTRSLALWLIRHDYLHHRTREPGGAVVDHYGLACYRLEWQVGQRIFGVRLVPIRLALSRRCAFAWLLPLGPFGFYMEDAR